jgi:hypothetical protein
MCVGVRAQTPSARDVLSFLMTTQGVQTDDIVKDQEAAEATRDTVARALLLELATLPLTTSSGAFSYRFNPAIGTVERVAQSFGPLFVDRGITGGRGQSSISFTYRYADFVNLQGRDLRDASLITTANKFRDEAAPYDVEALSLNLRTTTVTLSGNYGVTDVVDVGVAVPIVSLEMSGERINTYYGRSFLQARGTASSTGLGDVAVRTKIQLLRKGVSAVGANFELRLPTGSEENLRGAGKAALRSMLVISAGEGAVEGHANVGYAMGGVSNEVAFSGAVSAAVAERLTLSAETLIRRMAGLHDIREVIQQHPSVSGVDTIRLLPTGGAVTTTTAVAGMRWNLSRTWLLNGYVLVPVGERGLRARPTPAFSIEYSIVP